MFESEVSQPGPFKAAVATGFGGPEVLRVVEVDAAAPGPGEVTLAVRAAGVNPIDVKLYSGMFGTDPAKLPIRLGLEVAGVVLAVGPGADGPAGPVSVGDEVIAYPVQGGYAERVTVPAAAVVPRPAGLSWAAAGGLLLTGATAVHALTATRVGAGDTVLIHAAAGGVGAMAVQLALSRGARVIGTSGPAKHDYLRELGAEPVGYGDGLAARVRALAPDGVDAALDAVGTDEAVDVSIELVADRGRIATIAAFERGAQLGVALLGGGPGADPGTMIRDAARLELVKQVESGALKVFVGETFALADVAAAHRMILAGHSQGKIVIVFPQG